MAKTSPSSTRKKVVIRRLDGEVVRGYLDPSNLLEKKEIGLLDREGHLVHIPLDVVKGVYFVRDFEASTDRASLSASRGHPRLSGIWIRMTFSDGEVLEGLMPTNLMDVEPPGFMVTPADYSSNNLRIFVPRSALGTVEVLGVIADGKVLRAHRRARRVRPKPTGDTAQISLFPPPSRSEPEQVAERKSGGCHPEEPQATKDLVSD